MFVSLDQLAWEIDDGQVQRETYALRTARRLLAGAALTCLGAIMALVKH